MLLLPVFWSVTFWVLFAFRLRFPKLMDAGVTTSSAKAFSPVPARARATIPSEALLLMSNVAEVFPTEVGENVITKDKLVDGKIVAGIAGPLAANCGLEIEREASRSAAVPELLILSVCDWVWPTTTVLKLKWLAETRSEGVSVDTRDLGCA
jgi:hypothetical protein